MDGPSRDIPPPSGLSANRSVSLTFFLNELFIFPVLEALENFERPRMS